jgi:hypothetical protein
LSAARDTRLFLFSLCGVGQRSASNRLERVPRYPLVRIKEQRLLCGRDGPGGVALTEARDR